MKKSIIYIFLFAITAFSFSSDQKQERIQKAHDQIVQMKQSVILVRLSDKAPVIKALEEKGMEQRAKAIKARQDALNKEIMLSFSNFNFCEVYFFYSDDSEFLQNKNFSKVQLFQSPDVLAKEVKLDTNFFVADFGMLSNDKEQRIETEQKEKTGISKHKSYKGSDINTSIKCMYLRDHNFNQLESPFPFYVRFHPSPIQSLSHKQVVERMNKQLIRFSSEN